MPDWTNCKHNWDHVLQTPKANEMEKVIEIRAIRTMILMLVRQLAVMQCLPEILEKRKGMLCINAFNEIIFTALQCVELNALINAVDGSKHFCHIVCAWRHGDGRVHIRYMSPQFNPLPYPHPNPRWVMDIIHKCTTYMGIMYAYAAITNLI